jgi:gliding motility-associated-like protein
MRGTLLFKAIFSVLLTLSVGISYSQTLYWIGGSGNFNDPKNWSEKAGGISANRIPDYQTAVVFGQTLAGTKAEINISGVVMVQSIDIRTYQGLSFVSKVPGSRIVIQRSLTNLLDNEGFQSDVDLEFRNSSLYEEGLISAGNNPLNCSVYIEKGNWQLNKIKQQPSKLFKIGSASVKMQSASAYVGNLMAANESELDLKSSVLYAYKSIQIAPQAKFTASQSYINKKVGDNQSASSFNFKMNAGSESVSMLPCVPNPTVIKPSCVPGCDGTVVITLPPGNCFNPAASGNYNVLVNNNPTCTPISGLNNVGPGTYTLTNVCFCQSDYVFLIFDANTFTFLESVNASVTEPLIASFVTNTSSITCNALCNGSISIAFVGGTAPYTFTVSRPTVPSFTTTSGGGLNVTNICAGTLSVTAQDSKNCSRTFTFNFSQPAPILPNPLTNSVTCNGACNGAYQISPTGGIAGYTVAFSNSSTFTVPAAGSAQITGLCPGPISATVTDANGCFVSTNTTITQPPALTVTPTQTNLACFSTCNGAASVAVSGGTSPYSFTWSPGPGNTAGINSLCAGPQTVQVADVNLCSQTLTFNITAPPAITLNVNGTNVLCNNQCNGSASVQASGGTGAVTFTWTGPGPFVSITSSVISNLCPGVYTLNAQDANNCTAQQTIEITQPPAATISANVSNNTCFSTCAGSATVTITGGNGAPFSYTWSPNPPSGQGTATISNLCAGSYTLSAGDASACPISTVITITQPTSVTPNVSSTSLTCNNVCTGVINANPTGGAGAPYTFTLVTPSSGVLNTPPPYTNLCSGIYTLSISDVSLCVTTRTINIAQPNPLLPSVSANSVSCFNACNGSLAGSVLGGTPGYTLFWTTPTGTVAGGNIVNQCAGVYTFNVTDANSCTVSTTFTLIQPTDITATLNVTDPTCNGGCNGSISANISGGTPGYTLNWSSGSGNPNNGLCAGNYTLLVTDANGCNRTFTAAVTAPPAITVAVNSSSTSCAGSCDGSATVTSTGGTAPYTYVFNTLPLPTTNTTGIISGLCAGNYIVNVTDANGCSTPLAFNIGSPPLLTAAITGILPTCNVCTGASTVTVAGGTPGYTVNWTNNVPAVVATGTAATGLCLGTYTANVIDASGCTASATVNIVNTVSVTVVTGGSGILCNGACTASATANALGGTLPYTYSWSPGAQTSQSINNLCAGTYSVLVTDNLGCSNTGTISFSQPPAITVTTSQTNIACFSNCNGALTNTISGGTPAYSFSWSPGGQTTSSLTNLCAGTYTIRVTDLNNCIQTRTFNVTESPSLTASFNATNPNSCVLNNGTICATPSGGSGSGYTYTWTPAGTGGANNACNVNLAGGNYSVIIADGAGCTTTLAASLSSPSGPTLNISTSSVSCFGGSSGSATAIVTGTGPFTYTWSPATTSVVNSATTTASGMVSGNYNISVTDAASGCITSQSLNIAQPSSLTISSNVSNLSCNAVCNGSITATVSGGTPGYNFNWLPAGTGTAITSLCAGNYTVNITDANLCTATRTFVVTQPASITVNATQTNVLCNGSCNGAVTLTATGGSVPYTFTWSPVGTFTGSSNNAVNNLCPNTYTALVTDNNGCTAIRNFTITQPTAISHTLINTNATCNSLCNATASQVVSGGTPTYTFSWSSSAASTQSLGALCAGNYTASVTDGNGCVSNRTFVVTQPSSITITTNATSPLCNNTCSGTITSTVSGGNGGYSFTWLPAGSGSSITNVCAGNYTLTVTDASLCTNNAVVTLTNPPAIQANVTFTNPLCNNNCNGIALSTPVNATAPLSFTWTNIPPSFTNSATALCAGTYSVFVSDANGCRDTQQVTLLNPPLLNISISSLPASCGSNNGSVTVNPSGGTPGYSFVWNPIALGTSSIVNNVGAGIYTVTVTDSQGCTNTAPVTVNNSNGPSSADVLSVNVNCFAQCTGAATVTNILGGTPGYTVSWLAPSPSSVNPVSNLCAGNYTAQIQDQLSCLLFTAVTISEPPPIDDNESIANALCAGVCNASISLSPSGGTSPYTFNWSNSATSSSVTGLCVGVHTATITDNLGCNFTATYNVTGQLSITGVVASTSNTCFGNCLGTSSVVAAGGGVPPYNFNWSNSQTGPVATSLCNGTYSVTITDFNGCQNTFTSSIISPNAIAALTAISEPSCGLCNGASSVTVNGGTAPYTYSWTNGGTAASEASLCAGLYQVTITDLNGCQQLINVPISNSNGITGENFQIQNELCFNDCNGSVTVTPIGGNPPVNFSWINPVSTSSTISNLCGGTYFVQMTDAQGCTRTSSVSVGSATNIVITPTVISPSCASVNGTITVGVTGGSGVYTYSWLPAGNTATLANVGPGVYTLTVNDGSCTKSVEVAVNSSSAPMILSEVTNNGCSSGICTGSVVITPTLGNPGYTVEWSNGNTTNTVTNLCSGVITVTVTDVLGCSATQSYSISENPAVNLSLPVIQDVTCNNFCDGAITLVPSGGVLPYTITWVPSVTVAPANPLTNLCAGNYTAIVTDVNGCSISRTVSLINPPSFTLNANISGATCNSSSDGAITTTVSGGTPSYTFSWSGASTFTTQDISNVSSGSYSLTITDSKGCLKDTVMVIPASFTVIADAGRDTAFCVNNGVLLNGLNSQNAIHYEWMLAPTTSSFANTATTQVVPATGSNTYILMVTSSVAACFDTDTIVVNSYSIPLVSAGPSQTISLYSSTQIGGSPTSFTGLTYTWIPSNNLTDPSSPNPVASNTINTSYTVFVTDANGCIGSDSMHVHLYPEVFIPNGFSPNADGRNDYWIIDNIQQFPENVVEVYNRWGELLFRSVGYNTPFDGRYKGKELPVGTYYYIINLNHPAYPNAYTGPLTIFR